MIEGTLKANGLVVSSIKMDRTGAEWSISAEAKIVSTVDGLTYASTRVTGFPPEVQAKASDFLAAVEKAIADTLFATVNGHTAPTEKNLFPDEPADDQEGIGEHFNKPDGTPSI